MNDQKALYRAILDAPDDDAPRLIYADWLDEHDQPDRAEFIRLQVEQARWAWYEPRYRELDRQAKRLLGKHLKAWSWQHEGTHAHGFRRGFNDAVALTASTFVRAAQDLFEAIPLTEVWINTDDDWDAMRNPFAERLTALRWGNFLGHRDAWEHRQFPQWQSLHSAGYSPFVDFAAEAGCRSLKTLHLDGAYQETSFLRFTRCPHLRQLESLRLTPIPQAQYSEKLRAVGCRQLLDTADLRRLRYLALDHQAIGDAGLLHLTRHGPFERLAELHFVGNDIGATGTTALEEFFASANFPNLKVLNVSANPLGMAGVRELAAWPGLRTLRALRVEKCELSSAALERLIDSPYVHENLLIFTDEGVREFR